MALLATSTPLPRPGPHASHPNFRHLTHKEITNCSTDALEDAGEQLIFYQFSEWQGSAGTNAPIYFVKS